MDHAADAQEVLPRNALTFVAGTPMALGLGIEYERAFSEDDSLAFQVGSFTLLGNVIGSDDIIQVDHEMSLATLYRHYPGRRAPVGGYGLLGAVFYYAGTNGGDLTLFHFVGGGGYKWQPIPSFVFSLQGGITLGNGDEVSAERLSIRETASPRPVGILISVQLGTVF
jgi:hypothetical protein